MSPRSVLCIVGVLLSAKAVLSFVFKTLSAKSFRKKIALPRGFAEGVMTGLSYPLLLGSLILMLAQTVLFFIISPRNELTAIFRLLIFVLTALVCGAFDRRTPALRAYWFGKSYLYETRRHRISYFDIYGAKTSQKISLSGGGGQQFCKISFFVKDRSFFFGRKKYVCRMTAYAINELANHVEFNNRAQAHLAAPPFKKRALSFLLSMLLTLLTFSLALPCFSLGILNNEAYSEPNTVLTAPLETVSPISEIGFTDGRLCVYYEALEAFELYDENGNFDRAVSLPASGLKSSDFSVRDGSVNYRYGDVLVRYYPSSGELYETRYSEEQGFLFEPSDSPITSDTGDTYTHDGNSVFRKKSGEDIASGFITRSPLNRFFNIEITWIFTAILLTLSFVIHFVLTDRPKASAQRSKEPKGSKSVTGSSDSLPSDWTA